MPVSASDHAISTAIVLQAEDVPLAGIGDPVTHQRFCNPRLSVQPTSLTAVAPGHVRIDMIYAGVCGTDIHLISADPKTGYVKSSAPASIPANGRVIGHEGVGRVAAVGEGVSHLRIGEIIAPESIVSCGHCEICRRGWFNQCRHSKLLGMEIDGLFAAQSDIPVRLAQPVGSLANHDDGLKSAALLEPAGVAYLACQNAKISPGDRVAILGAGPIGVLTAMLAKLVFGASRVDIVEPVAFRRNLAAEWCDHVYTPAEFMDTDHRLDVFIEAAGCLDAAMTYFRRLDAHGRLCLLARSGKPLNLDAVDHLITNNISIIGYRGHLGGIFEILIRLIELDRLPVGRLVTKVVSGLSELCAVLKTPEIIVAEHCKVLCKF